MKRWERCCELRTEGRQYRVSAIPAMGQGGAQERRMRHSSSPRMPSAARQHRQTRLTFLTPAPPAAPPPAPGTPSPPNAGIPNPIPFPPPSNASPSARRSKRSFNEEGGLEREEGAEGETGDDMVRSTGCCRVGPEGGQASRVLRGTRATRRGV